MNFAEDKYVNNKLLKDVVANFAGIYLTHINNISNTCHAS